MPNPLEYGFWADAKPNESLSYQALQTRRKIAESLMGKRSPFPKTLGEGLTYAGERFADAMDMRGLDAQERARQQMLTGEAQTAVSNMPTDPGAPPSPAINQRVSDATETPAVPAIEPPSVLGPNAPVIPPTPRRPAPVVTAANIAPAAYNPDAAAPDISGGANAFSDPGGGRPGGPAYAGPSGNAPGRFGPVMRSPGGNMLALPEQPPPGRFTTALGPTPTPRDAVAAAVVAQDEGALPANAQLRVGGAVPAVPYANPAIPSDITPAPDAQVTRVADNVPRLRQPLNPDQQQPLPPAPRPVPMHPNETRAIQRMMAAPDDPDVQRIWAPIAAAHAAQRKMLDARNDEVWKAQVARTGKEQDYANTYPTNEQAFRLKQLEEAGKTPTPVTPAPVGYDRRLGTETSPQRNGPTMPPPPPNVEPEAWRKLHGPKLVAVTDAVEKGTPQIMESIDLLKQAQTHPGRAFGQGALSRIATAAPGTPAYDFGVLIKEIGGQNFLAGYNTLRGAGAIGVKEGEKAQEARARLSPEQTEAGFNKGLNDLEITLRSDLERAQRAAGQPVTAWQHSQNDPYAPDKGQRMLHKGEVQEYIGGNPALDTSYRRLR